MTSDRVLVVEDDDAIRQLLMSYLEQHSRLHCEGARDGVEALHLLSQSRYAVVVLDLMMPKMSGVDLLDSLNALTSDPSVKALDRPPAVVVITGATNGDVPSDAITQRCSSVRGVFRKPLDLTALAAEVEQHLRA